MSPVEQAADGIGRLFHVDPGNVPPAKETRVPVPDLDGAAAARYRSSQFRVVTAEDADGGLRLSLVGNADSSCIDLRDIVVAALRSEPPRVEVDLRSLDSIDEVGVDFLLACRRLPRCSASSTG